ncbi:MAG: TonB-dependent receptor [Nitrospirota bacterium]|nr:TonB-dependent receptor [Nitrospirota bacterium]MDE3243830.1 TonB-dependent receptor [Nitrospirota bacterium]
MGTDNHRRKWRRVAVIAGVAGTLVTGGAGWAQESPPAEPVSSGGEMVLETRDVEIKGQKIENIETIRRELETRPGSNILIEEQQIKESRMVNLQDVLQFAPGVRFQSRFGADEGQFQIRGTSLRNNFHHRGINILINGIFFGDADGFSDFESIDLMAYERIEVYKGANALRYGANSIGGAINFVPRTGYNASALQMQSFGGSFGMYMGQVSSGKVLQPFKVGNMNATSDYYISTSGTHMDGYQTNGQQSRQRLNANFGLQLGEHQELRLYILQSNVSERLPGSLTTGQLFADPTQAGGRTPGANPAGGTFFSCNLSNEACKYGRYQNYQRIGVAYRYEFTPTQFIEVVPYFSNQYIDHPIFQTIRQDNMNVGGEIRYSNNDRLLGMDSRFVVGHQPRYTNQHQQRFVNINGSIGALAQNAFLRTTYFGTYAEDQLDVNEKLTLVAGIRWDYSGRQGVLQSYSPVGAPTQNAASALSSTQNPLRHYNAINPKFGFVYRTTETSQLYFNASRGYEAPINAELTSAFNFNGTANTGFLNLDAQRAWQFELGHRGKTKDGRYQWDFTVYNLEMQKEILTNVINNQNTFMNANGTRHTGLELGGGMVATRGLFVKGASEEADQISLRAMYTWSHFVFTEDVYGATTQGGPANQVIAKKGNFVAGAPQHSIAYEMRYDHPKSWWIAPNIEYVPTGIDVNYLNTAKAPAYFVVNMKAGWEIGNGLRFFAEGRNLTDKTYAGAVVVNDPFLRYANVAWGRNAFAGLEWKF